MGRFDLAFGKPLSIGVKKPDTKGNPDPLFGSVITKNVISFQLLQEGQATMGKVFYALKESPQMDKKIWYINS